MRIDKDTLLAEANAIEVAEYIGMTVVKKGANHFTLCPGHKNRIGKEDVNIGNCVLYENGYRCLACDPTKTHDVFDMVMEFTGCTFPEALATVAEIYGGASLFASNSPYIEKLTVTQEDLKLIGLQSSVKKICPQNISWQHFQPEEGTSINKVTDNGLDMFLSMKSSPTETLLALKQKHPDEYRRLIATRAKIAGQKYCLAIKQYSSRSASGASKVFDLFEDNGGVDDAVFIGIKNALMSKAWRCKEIYERSVL
jgi:hypothetical protein